MMAKTFTKITYECWVLGKDGKRKRVGEYVGDNVQALPQLRTIRDAYRGYWWVESCDIREVRTSFKYID